MSQYHPSQYSADPQQHGYGQPPQNSSYLAQQQYGTPQGYYPGTPSGETNPWAIASLVLAIFGTAIFAVITGHIALSQINRTNGGGRGLAIAGLIIGYMTVAVYVLLLIGLVALGWFRMASY